MQNIHELIKAFQPISERFLEAVTALDGLDSPDVDAGIVFEALSQLEPEFGLSNNSEILSAYWLRLYEWGEMAGMWQEDHLRADWRDRLAQTTQRLENANKEHFSQLVYIRGLLLCGDFGCESYDLFLEGLEDFSHAIELADAPALEQWRARLGFDACRILFLSKYFEDEDVRQAALSFGKGALRDLDLQGAPLLWYRLNILIANCALRCTGTPSPDEYADALNCAANAAILAWEAERPLEEAEAWSLVAQTIIETPYGRPPELLKWAVFAARRSVVLFRTHSPSDINIAEAYFRSVRALYLHRTYVRTRELNLTHVRLIQKAGRTYLDLGDRSGFADAKATEADVLSKLTTGDFTDNVTAALACYDDAISAYAEDENTFMLARMLHDKALLLTNSPIGDTSDRRAEALSLFEQSRSMQLAMGDEISVNHLEMNLGEFYYEQYEGDRDPGTLEMAIETLQRVVSKSELHGDEDSKRLANLHLAEALTAKADIGFDECGQRAEELLNHLILTANAETELFLSDVYWKRANLFAQRHRQQSSETCYQTALRDYDQALFLSPTGNPDRRMRLVSTRARLHMTSRNWTAAIDDYGNALLLAQDIADSARSREGRRYASGHTRFVFAELAFALARAGQTEKALNVNEQGKFQLRSGVFVQKIHAIGRYTLVSFLVTRFGCGAFIACPHRNKVEFIDVAASMKQLEEITYGAEPDDELGGWLGHYQDLPRFWGKPAQITTEILWDMMIAPIEAGLIEFGVQGHDIVELSLHETLFALPITAAQRSCEGALKPWLADHPLFLRGQHNSSIDWNQPVSGSGAVLVHDSGDIPSASEEARCLERQWGFVNKPAETLRTLEDTLQTFSTVHIASHAFYDWNEPDASALVFLDELPTAHQLEQLQRIETDLVVLSSCESGVGDIVKWPGELQGIPGALLYSGVRALLVSLWSIDDLATFLFMSKFYQALIAQQLAPPVALQHAQLHMMQLENKDIDDTLGLLVRDAKERSDLISRLASRRFSDNADAPPDIAPISSPANWAAFVLYA